MRVREPVARPLDVVSLELLLSASQAFVVGVLLYLAIGLWDDRGVGVGPVAIILALLGLAVGGAWLYWVLGGVGWPLAAAATPVALFLGFLLVMSWMGEELFAVSGAPLLLAALASGYGIVCGVFLDSPRRWRWDQREKPRRGTKVPRVSPTTQALAARIPRSLPRRPSRAQATSELAARIERSTPPAPEPTGDVGVPYVRPASDEVRTAGRTADRDDAPVEAAPRATTPPAPAQPPARTPSRLADAPDVVGVPIAAGTRSTRTTPRRSSSARAPAPDAIELPTAVEPRAQRSPWAWAAPPEWNRDEEDEAAVGQPARRA